MFATALLVAATGTTLLFGLAGLVRDHLELERVTCAEILAALPGWQAPVRSWRPDPDLARARRELATRDRLAGYYVWPDTEPLPVPVVQLPRRPRIARAAA